MPGERMVVGAKCQGTTGECQVNLWEWVQFQGNTGEYKGMPGERMGVGVNCLGNGGNERGIPGECMGVGV